MERYSDISAVKIIIRIHGDAGKHMVSALYINRACSVICRL